MSVLDALRLDGRVAVVTGASRGLGRAAAHALAEAGADVGLLARDEPRLEQVAAEIEAQTGRRALAVRADVADPPQVDAAIARIAEQLGRPAVLVNNAAMQRQGSLRDAEPEDWNAILATNVGGLLACSRAFLRTTGEPGGSIVNLASMCSAVGVPDLVAYCASKGAVDSATRALALETARHGVRVNAIAPGYFATDMPAAAMADPRQRERLLRRIPLRRLGEPEEIGPLVVYLASKASSYMTGSTLYLDGGYTAQ